MNPIELAQENAINDLLRWIDIVGYGYFYIFVPLVCIIGLSVELYRYIQRKKKEV